MKCYHDRESSETVSLFTYSKSFKMYRSGEQAFQFISKTITFFFIINLQCCLSFDPTIILPYQRISPSELNIIGNTLQCNETRNDIKSCAQECFKMENKKENCVGFLQDGNDCFLCKVLDRDGVNSYLFTNITDNQILYILKSPKDKPNVYISMDEYNLTTRIITGHRVSGGSAAISADDLIPGKVGQAIHFHSNGRIYPTVEQPECFCSFYYCNGKLSISFWARKNSTGGGQAITQLSGFVVTLGQKVGGWFTTHEVHLGGFNAKTDLSPTKWALITYVVNMDVGISTYYNAMREGFAPISAASPRNTAPLTSCGRVIMGAKHTWGAYAINGELDEIKFFYKDLTPAEIWREYLGFEGLDLTPQLVIPHNDLEGEQTMLLVDENVTTCVEVKSCGNKGPGLGVKLYNTAEDKSNFTVKIHIQNFHCNVSQFYVYGDQQETANFRLYSNDFIGSFMELRLAEERSTDNICEYRLLANEFWPYVFIKIFNKGNHGGRICEVVLN